MSSHGRIFYRNAITRNPTFSSPSQASRTCFSQYTRRQQERRGPSGATDEPVDRTSNKQHYQHQQKPRSRRLPALAPFLFALPLGWYLSTRPYQSSSSSSIAYAKPGEFVQYTLVGKDAVSPTSAIFRLAPSAGLQLDLDDPALARAVTSVQFKQPQLQIARAYTALPHADGQPFHEIRFLIRRERRGEVSGFLHDLRPSTTIELRGPHAEYVLPPHVGSVAFLAGGTGIAPALQVADVLEGEADMHVLWASRKREDCEGGRNDTAAAAAAATARSWWPRWGGTRGTASEAAKDAAHNVNTQGEIVRRLEGLKEELHSSGSHNGKIRVDYFVDEEGTVIRPADVQRTLNGLRQNDQLDNASANLLFVSGPEGFVNYWAGPKQWINGREAQGPLGGVLQRLDLRGWQVIKL